MLTCQFICEKDDKQMPRSVRENRVERGSWFLRVSSIKRVH